MFVDKAYEINNEERYLKNTYFHECMEKQYAKSKITKILSSKELHF